MPAEKSSTLIFKIQLAFSEYLYWSPKTHYIVSPVYLSNVYSDSAVIEIHLKH